MIYAGILAGGLGRRMHRIDMPKQFLMLGDKPILIHTLEQFCINAPVGRVIIVIPEEWAAYSEDLIAQHDTFGKEIHLIPGGQTKADSIAKIVGFVRDKWGIQTDDLLVTHDAIRPFVTQRIINDNIAAAAQHGAANTVMSQNDTILASQDGETADSIPPKETMFSEQTPQSFSLPLLQRTLQAAKAKKIFTREDPEIFRLFLSLDIPVRLVRGEYSNMKIVTPYDLEIAQALLKVKGSVSGDD